MASCRSARPRSPHFDRRSLQRISRTPALARGRRPGEYELRQFRPNGASVGHHSTRPFQRHVRARRDRFTCRLARPARRHRPAAYSALRSPRPGSNPPTAGHPGASNPGEHVAVKAEPGDGERQYHPLPHRNPIGTANGLLTVQPRDHNGPPSREKMKDERRGPLPSVDSMPSAAPFPGYNPTDLPDFFGGTGVALTGVAGR